MVEVVGTDEFEEWFQELDDSDTDAVARVVDMLEQMGTSLPFPYSSALDCFEGASHPIGWEAATGPLRL